MSKVFIVYGEMGMGKNFVGELIAQHLDLDFVDGDSLLPRHMAEKVKSFKPFTAEEIREYVELHITPFLITRGSSGLVFAQALYRSEHRQYIEEALEEVGLETVFVFIPTHSLITHLSRLLSRPRGLMWAIFGLLNKPFFQKSGATNHITILNNSTKEVLLDRISKIKWH